MIKSNKSQSIVEYLLFLTMIIAGIFIGTGFLRRGVESGLNQTQEYLEGSLPSTLNGTYNGRIITYQLPGSQGGQ